MFSWILGSIWGTKVNERQGVIPIWIQTRFYSDFGFIVGVILGARIDEKNIENSIDFGGILGVSPRINSTLQWVGTG